MESSQRLHLPAWLLGSDPGQRRRASQALMVLGIYALYHGLQQLPVALGLVPARETWIVAAVNLAGGSLIFGLIRSGWNLRRRHDRALMLPQALLGISCAVWAYAISGPARGAILLVLMNVIVFCIFALRPAQVRRLAGVAFAGLLLAMAWKALGSAQPYDAALEGVHLAFAAVTIAAVSLLAERIGRMRDRLETQRSELEQALARIRTLATCDELTGLLNRRAAMDCLRRDSAQLGRGGPVLTLALIDLDHFKQVNDNHGHAAGDAVLRRFAEAARDTLRSGDTLARWGGEEFLLVLPTAPPAAALETLARLRTALQARDFGDIAPGLRVSFSAGVAACRGAQDLEAAIERADVAMYAAKQAGRDRTLLAPEAVPA